MGKGDHPKTFLLKALCCQSAPSWVRVVGWWWWVAHEIILSSPGSGVTFQFLFPIPNPSPMSQSLDNTDITCYILNTLNRITKLLWKTYFSSESYCLEVVSHGYCSWRPSRRTLRWWRSRWGRGFTSLLDFRIESSFWPSLPRLGI